MQNSARPTRLLIQGNKMPFTDFTSSTHKKRTEKPTTQYMVDFTLPELLTDEFISAIPFQRSVVNRLMAEGKLTSYALSLENSKLWATFSTHSEADLMDMIASLPLSRYMKIRFSELTFFHTSTPFEPAFSIN